MSAWPGGVCLARGVCPGGEYTTPLWTEFLTQACENITFLQLRLRTVKIRVKKYKITYGFFWPWPGLIALIGHKNISIPTQTPSVSYCSLTTEPPYMYHTVISLELQEVLEFSKFSNSTDTSNQTNQEKREVVLHLCSWHDVIIFSHFKPIKNLIINHPFPTNKARNLKWLTHVNWQASAYKVFSKVGNTNQELRLLNYIKIPVLYNTYGNIILCRFAEESGI